MNWSTSPSCCWKQWKISHKKDGIITSMCFTWILFCEWQCLIYFFWNVVKPIFQTEHWTHKILVQRLQNNLRFKEEKCGKAIQHAQISANILSTWNLTKNPILKTIELDNVAYPVEKVMGLWCARIPEGMKLLHGSSISFGANVLRLWAWAAQAQHGHRHLTANFANKKQWAVCLSQRQKPQHRRTLLWRKVRDGDC